MSQKYQLHTVFPSCLYVAEVENAEQRNKAMLPQIYELREQDRKSIKDPELLSVFEYDVWSTYFSHPGIGLINESWTRDLRRAVLENTDRFAKLLQLDFGERRPHVTTLFANIHDKPYHRHDAHTHPGSMFSGTYFVKTYPGAGKFRLINPCRALQFHEFSSYEDTELNVNEVSLDPVAGRIVMFQSHIPHAVDRPATGGERIAVAFNVNYD